MDKPNNIHREDITDQNWKTLVFKGSSFLIQEFDDHFIIMTERGSTSEISLISQEEKPLTLKEQMEKDLEGQFDELEQDIKSLRNSKGQEPAEYIETRIRDIRALMELIEMNDGQTNTNSAENKIQGTNGNGSRNTPPNGGTSNGEKKHFYRIKEGGVIGRANKKRESNRRNNRL